MPVIHDESPSWVSSLRRNSAGYPWGCIRMHSEAIGSVWTFSKFFEIFWIVESFFNVFGRNFYKRLFHGTTCKLVWGKKIEKLISKICPCRSSRIKERISIKNFRFALRLRICVQKFLPKEHNLQPQPSDHGSWICILRWRRRGLRPVGSDHKMQIQDPWSDGCVCGCGCGWCLQVQNFCTKVLNLRAKPKFLMHIIRPFICSFAHRKSHVSSGDTTQNAHRVMKRNVMGLRTATWWDDETQRDGVMRRNMDGNLLSCSS